MYFILSSAWAGKENPFQGTVRIIVMVAIFTEKVN